MTKIYYSQFTLWSQVTQAKQTWPFFAHHQVAEKSFIQQVKKGRAYFFKNIFVAAEVCGTALVIDHLFLLEEHSWQQLLLRLEQFARQRFVVSLVLKIAPGPVLADWLKMQNFQQTINGFEKKLSYQTALVLGGGGARGAYQIGVWQALKEKKITFSWIVGTSVGALNGAFVAQEDFPEAVALWEEISTDKVLDLAFRKMADLDPKASQDLSKMILTETVRQRGISTAPLKKLLQRYLKAGVASCPLYIVTTQLPQFKETVVSLEKLSLAERLNWLLASASFFPVMAMTEIEGKNYIDGGYRNNLPIDVAEKLGAGEIIAVDVQGPGFTKRGTLKDATVLLNLKSSWGLGEFLIFEKNQARDNILLGYFETKKAFGDYFGLRYTFSSATGFKELTAEFLKQQLKKNPQLTATKILESLRTFSKDTVVLENTALILLEALGFNLRLSPLKIYSLPEFIGLLVPEKPTVKLRNHLLREFWLFLQMRKK